MNTPEKELLTATIEVETVAQFLARDRANNPSVYAVHDALMSGFVARPSAKTWIVGGKQYGHCAACGEIVRLNKPFIGSLHLCS